LNYSEKQNIPLGNKDILYQLIQKAERIIDEVEILTSADESLESDKKTDGDLTEPYFSFYIYFSDVSQNLSSRYL
jgi:hypothetical protein